jgi:hypothetical protein
MKILNLSKIFLISSMVIYALALTGCSDSDEKEKKATAEAKFNPFDHTHDVEVPDIQKHKFEHDFARQCVERELQNSVNKEADKERLTEDCMCIATYMMKDLTAKEAEKFITEHESPRSLEIKFDSAAFHCLQKKPLPKGPNLFGRPQQ